MSVTLPSETLTDSQILQYANLLSIPHFVGVKMRDELSKSPRKKECGILNFQTHDQGGSHWTCWFKDQNHRYYFDSFAEQPPQELLEYLKTPEERINDSPVIRRSAVIVQHINSNECGALSLFVLKCLSSGVPFSTILLMLEKRFKLIPTPPLTIKTKETAPDVIYQDVSLRQSKQAKGRTRMEKTTS